MTSGSTPPHALTKAPAGTSPPGPWRIPATPPHPAHTYRDPGPGVEAFRLSASRSENLRFPQNDDAYSTDIINAGRRPSQELPGGASASASVRSGTVARRRGRYDRAEALSQFVDDGPWSTQATHYPEWLLESGPRLSEPGNIE